MQILDLARFIECLNNGIGAHAVPHIPYHTCCTTHAEGEVGISLDSLDRNITPRRLSLSVQPGVTSTISTVVIYIAIRVERRIGEDMAHYSLS